MSILVFVIILMVSYVNASKIKEEYRDGFNVTAGIVGLIIILSMIL